jgi:hypothetical protein
VRPPNIHDIDPLEFRQINKLDTVGSKELAHAARWLAPGMRLHIVITAILHYGSGPVLVGNFRAGTIASKP